MDLHLKNKVIIVTGGFKGIGKGITLRLAEEGAIPVVLNRSDGADDEFRQDIEQVTDSYDTYLIDLNNTDEIAPIVESVMKKYGHIDGVVNNAGRNDNLALETTSWRQFEESLHGNLTHYYELVHQRGPALKASKLGGQYRFQDRIDRSGQDQRLRCGERRDSGFDPRVGRRPRPGRGPGQCRRRGRSADTAVRAMDQDVRRRTGAARAVGEDHRQDSSRPPHDRDFGNRGHRGFPSV